MEVLLKMRNFTGITSELGLPTDRTNSRSRESLTTQVIIATPGTINKWIAIKKLATSDLKILVFDEANHMLAEVILWIFVFRFFRLSIIAQYGFLNCIFKKMTMHNDQLGVPND